MQSTCVYQPSSETIRNQLLIQKEIRLRFIIFRIRNSALSSLELAPKLTNLIDDWLDCLEGASVHLCPCLQRTKYKETSTCIHCTSGIWLLLNFVFNKLAFQFIISKIYKINLIISKLIFMRIRSTEIYKEALPLVTQYENRFDSRSSDTLQLSKQLNSPHRNRNWS
jgi:hypothetical protein